MINTAFRLIIFVPAALAFAALGVLALGSDEFGFGTSLAFALMALFPAALIVWSLADHRRRARAKDDFSA